METLSANRSICTRPEQAARCSGSTEEQTSFSTNSVVADGFLKHSFLPLYDKSGALPEKKLVEQGFFESLSILTSLYELQPMNVSDKSYPYTILLAHWDALRQLNKTNKEQELSIIQDEQDNINLVTRQTYNTGTTLYYIPVLPLYRLIKKNEHKKSAELILSVFSYLYHIACVPYYTDDCSALSYYYEMVREWLFEDLDSQEETELNRNVSELNAAEHYGEVIFRKIYNRYHLDHFKERLDRFTATDAFGLECLEIAQSTFDLYTRYPDRSIFYHIKKDNEEREYEDGIIRAEQYISFIADTEGWLYGSIAEMVNNEFNECADMEEPCIEQVFDLSAKDLSEGLEFEQQIFPLITDLCALLNNLP
ncbi:MAG TPA: hypothetical protein VGB63_18690 [Pedobacter sp.]|jgi:hypothetical protein